VELRAGANINVILGPNGTGKSSIVCAICIGLAGKQKILSRALALKEYIRHGCDSATVEIELFNPDGLNWVIKRCIKAVKGQSASHSSNREIATGASSKWYLNAKKTQPAVVSSFSWICALIMACWI
jgi:chromosome segregation ATPase